MRLLGEVDVDGVVVELLVAGPDCLICAILGPDCLMYAILGHDCLMCVILGLDCLIHCMCHIGL